LVNKVGTDAQSFAQYQFGTDIVSGPAQVLSVINNLPPLILMLDPRAQFSLDLLSSSFGTFEGTQ
jgi:hypothetical protein